MSEPSEPQATGPDPVAALGLQPPVDLHPAGLTRGEIFRPWPTDD
jgi:hypothetical protein